jgi:hypothetical protein
MPTAHITATWATRRAIPWECLHLDTGIAIKETHTFVDDVCRERRWPLVFYRALENTDADGRVDPQDYDKLVMERGFPGPAMHPKMYDRLKGRSVERYVRDHKQHHKDRIMFSTGVRKQESQRRMGLNTPIRRMGATVWVNPLFWWGNPQRDAYNRQESLPLNPVKQCLGISGDCLCGAFGHPGELLLMKRYYPYAYERLAELAAKVSAAGLWGSWGVKPPPWYTEQSAANQRTFMPLCIGCENRHRTLHIADYRTDFLTPDRLIGHLHTDGYHDPISAAAAELYARYPEHHWRYSTQYASGSTLWIAQDTPDHCSALVKMDGTVDISHEGALERICS